jgi:DNA-binding NarL/FixJ family response regulator
MRTPAKTNRRIRVLLVDDHPLFRNALRDVIGRERDLTVCAEAENREDALSAMAAARPDLAIVDLKLKNSDGLELVKDIHDRFPKTFTLVLSMHDELLHAERALRAGAGGYISKQEGPDKIMHAIREVLAGEVYCSERVAHTMASRIARPLRGNKDHSPDLLSERELKVFELIGTGYTTPQIAASLHISPSTVETYRIRIKEKLVLKGAAELRQEAIRWNVARAAG